MMLTAPVELAKWSMRPPDRSEASPVGHCWPASVARHRRRSTLALPPAAWAEGQVAVTMLVGLQLIGAAEEGRCLPGW